MEYSIQDFLDMFNDGDIDVIKYFNDFETFFNVLKRKGLISELDPIKGAYSEDWQNEYLIWAYNNDKDKFYYWVKMILSDVEFDENNNAILVVSDRSELARLFCDGHRYDLSQKTVENILSGESDWFEYFSNTTDDIYRDVVEELNPKNIERLKERVVDELKDIQISPETEVMEEIAKEQGHPEYWTIDSNNVTRIIDDEESFNSLLDDELSDLKGELYNVHSSAYNNAYEEEIYEDIWNELDDYFVGRGKFEIRPHPYKKDTQREYFKVPIKDFEGVVVDYLENNKNYGNNGTLEYQGSFIGLIQEDRDCLSARVSDYPDSRKVDRNINDYFQDYI